MPRFAALRGNRKRQSIPVPQGVGFASGLGLPDGGVGECHAKLLEVRVMAWIVAVSIPFRQHKTGTSITPIHGLKNGLKNFGCPWISIASNRP